MTIKYIINGYKVEWTNKMGKRFAQWGAWFVTYSKGMFEQAEYMQDGLNRMGDFNDYLLTLKGVK